MGRVSSEIIEDSLQAHGQRYVRERHVDHLGREHLFSYTAPGDADVEAIMSARVVHVLNLCIDGEIRDIISRVENGTPLPHSLEFCTLQQLKEKAIERVTTHSGDITLTGTRKDRIMTALGIT